MKKAKAIELLKLAVPVKALTQQEYSDFVEAVNMGIDALEQPTTSDLISRQAALEKVRTVQTYKLFMGDEMILVDKAEVQTELMMLPTIQPEPSILLSWVEKYIEWLRSLDNEFANLAAAHISVMVKKWRDEQDERTD